MVDVRTPAGRLSVACVTCVAALWLVSAAPRGASPSPDLVISQVYGGGGGSGALLAHDYVEIFNRGTAAVSLDGYSLQYASARSADLFGGTASSLTELPAVTLQPGQYFLVRQGSGGAIGSALPTPDYIDATPINMAPGAGKVALVLGDASLGCNGGATPCPPAALARIVDLVGYGTGLSTGANFFEGTSAAPSLSQLHAAFRADGGCTDTDNNGNDFVAAAPAPRHTASALNSCHAATLSIADVSVAEGDTGTTTATFTVSLTAAAAAGGVTFSIATADGTATTAGNDYLANSLSNQVIPAGQQSYTFDVPVNGDLDLEADEAFAVEVTAISGARAGDTSAVGTILNDDVLTTPIHVIQGNGPESPFVNQLVAVRGVVTALKSNGFFVQTAVPSLEDGDPSTSEGVFVFTGSASTVAVGDLVTAHGTVFEVAGLTEISVPPFGTVKKHGSGAVPDAVVLTPAILASGGPATQLERLEGMLVTAPAVTSVAPTNQFGEIHTVLNGVARPLREPGIEQGMPIPNDPVTGQPDCCIPVWDGNPERLVIDTDGLLGAQPLWVTSKVTLTNVAGPLDYTSGEYKVLASPVAGPNMTVVPVPDPSPNEFTVAGYNVTAFFGLEPQLSKAALHIRDVMKYPDVIGMVEIASLEALQTLANRVNSDAGAANPGYAAYLIPFGDGSQHVGFLVKSSRVLVESVTQEQTNDTFVHPTGGFLETTHDRPPLVLTATIQPTGGNPGRVIVVVNHLRTFLNIDSPGDVGPWVRAKRTAQAESIARLLQELQQNNTNVPVISVGDYSAFEFNDGYTDPMSVIAGAPTPDNQMVVGGSPDLVNPDFINLTGTVSPAERYSFIFEGTPHALDHVLVNSVGQALFQRYAIARSNADFPSDDRAGLRQNTSMPDSHSDHDSPVAYFAFAGTAPVVTLIGDLSPHVEAFTSYTDPGATARDDFGPLPVTVSGAVNVNVPGIYVLRYSATNGSGTTVVERTVTVADTIAPGIAGFAVSPGSLWPPNNQMVNVAAAYSVTDASGVASCALSVSSNKPANGKNGADWVVLGPMQLQLRAEKGVGGGDTRVYTVEVTCTDNSGNAASRTATVAVAK